MKAQKRKLDTIDKFLLVITLILIILNVCFIFNIVQIHNGISTLVLSVSMLVLGCVTFKKQSKKIGYMYFAIALGTLITGIIGFI